MGIKEPKIADGYGLSIEAMVYLGEDLILPSEPLQREEDYDEAALLDLESLHGDINKYRKHCPSLEETIDLSFILQV